MLNNKQTFLKIALVSGSVAFCVALLYAIFGLYVVLPFMFPELHHGMGLLKNSDSVYFFSRALELSALVELAGWSQWSLVYEDQLPIGLSAAIINLSGIEHPLIIIAFNCFLVGLGTCFLAHRLFDAFSVLDARKIWLWVLFPSALLVYGQVHRDAPVMLGICILIWGLPSICYRVQVRQALMFGLSCLVGLSILAVARPYLFELVVIVLFAILMIHLFLALRLTGFRGAAGTLLRILILVSCWAIGNFSVLEGRMLASRAATTESNVLVKNIDKAKTNELRKEIEALYPDGSDDIADKEIEALYPDGSDDIESCSIGENFIDSIVMQVYATRVWSLNTGGSTRIDPEIRLCGSLDAIEFAPRAFQVGAFSPFIFGLGDLGYERWRSNPLMMVASLETLAFLIVALMLLYRGATILSSKDRLILVWCLSVIVFCVALMTIYAFAVPNLGTLVRVRFPFWMISMITMALLVLSPFSKVAR